MDFLVMEFLDGETLERRLEKGPLPPEQTIRYGAQIANALAKAHKLGITHRDLKPANVMLTKAGAKLLDFGLAMQSGPARLANALTQMTQEQSKLTSAGMASPLPIHGPEQLEGKPADARTDIFAFGEVLYEMATGKPAFSGTSRAKISVRASAGFPSNCSGPCIGSGDAMPADARTDIFAFGEVLYEMATGKPAFSGTSRASLIAAILTTEPPSITQLQPLTPVTLERVVKKCLAKDPDDRWQSAADLASELQWMCTGSPTSQSAMDAGSRL